VRVAILGSGPAGLLAAFAAHQQGNIVTIFSEGSRSDIFGAQYLHRAIPQLTNENPDMTIDIAKVGTQQGYAKLVYGDRNAPVSWEHFEPGTIPAWDLRTVYANLWTMYEHLIVPGNVNWPDAARIAEDHDMTFSTIPMRHLCNRNGHKFPHINIWVLVQPPWMEKWDSGLHIMYYNGYPPDGSEGGWIGYDWYRFSKINGWSAWEYTKPIDPETDLWGDRYIVQGMKPMGTDCTCAEFLGITPIGRWGKWERGVLTHHAYEAVTDALLKV